MSNNVYYDPEAFGLTIVDEIEYSSGSWEFDTRVVWKDGGGKFYTARDSGCSCPIPFEDLRGLPDLEICNIDELRNEVREQLTRDWGVYITPEQGQEFIRTVEQAMRD